MKLLALLLPLLPSVLSAVTEVQDGQTGTLIVMPPQATNSGLKRIPDADHPFIAPGPGDQRGPCPGMNTLANHGYIPRDGVATFEELVIGIMESTNIGATMAAGMVAGNMLTRGNPFANKISIGGVSPKVPPLPFNIDGPQVLGIAKHGRVEGDASLSRSDAFIGDNRNFNESLFEIDLESLKLADDGPDGPQTVLNVASLVDMKIRNINTDQATNPKFAIPPRRLATVVAAPSEILGVFKNGTTNLATTKIFTSFFRDQTFPENWFRAAAPIMGIPQAANVTAALSQFVPGRNNKQGVFVPDPPAPAPFNISVACTAYWDAAQAQPRGFVNTTGIFKQNVDLLVGILFNGTTCPEVALPNAPPEAFNTI